MSKKQSDWEAQRTNRFCFVSSIPEQREDLKQKVKEYPFWAYIDHEADSKIDNEEDKGEHTHFMIKCKGTMSVRQIANQLAIPSHMVQPCRQERSYGRYFIHLDNTEKIQYKLSDITTNKPSRFVIWSTDNQDDDIRRLYGDLTKLRNGELTPKDFIDLHYVELSQLNLYQKIRIFDLLNPSPYLT